VKRFLHTCHLALPPLGLALVIFLLSAKPAPYHPPLFPHFDKVVHFGVYGILGFLLARWLAGAISTEKQRLVTLSVLLVGLYGITDEIHQVFTPLRSPDVVDAWADLLGAACGAPLGRWAVIVWRRHRAKND
jgi:VanZ family protein